MPSMNDRDAAFMWETEALRESQRRGEISDRPSVGSDSGGNWATLREGHQLTGIPVETLRKWARKGSVPTFLSESEIGVRRMIRMDAVRVRAHQLGRSIAPLPKPPTVALPDAPQGATEGLHDAIVLAPPAADATTTEALETEPGEDTPAPADTASEAPPGTMIVPIAAWDKMLMQLGNLHEAGQQLAEARERAGKAETEASFLRERLAEMRSEREASRASVSGMVVPPPPPAPDEPEPSEKRESPETGPGFEPARRPEKLWRYVYRGWRRRRK